MHLPYSVKYIGLTLYHICISVLLFCPCMVHGLFPDFVINVKDSIRCSQQICWVNRIPLLDRLTTIINKQFQSIFCQIVRPTVLHVHSKLSLILNTFERHGSLFGRAYHLISSDFPQHGRKNEGFVFPSTNRSICFTNILHDNKKQWQEN